MRKFRAIAATTQECLNEYQEAMTLEELNQWQGHNDILTFQYDSRMVIGRITHTEVVAGSPHSQLLVEGVLLDDSMPVVGLYVAVSYTLAAGITIPRVYALTPSPADTGTTPIEFINENLDGQ